MNGLSKWVMGMLKQHCSAQFEAAMGMSVEEMQAACARGDKAVLQRIRQHGEQLQREKPEVCRQAASWAQTAFPSASAGGNTQNNTNPTTIERTH